jgi:hypothetical protein
MWNLLDLNTIFWVSPTHLFLLHKLSLQIYREVLRFHSHLFFLKKSVHSYCAVCTYAAVYHFLQ